MHRKAVINQVLHRRKSKPGLSPLEIIFLWDLDPRLLFEIFIVVSCLAVRFQFVGLREIDLWKAR